MQVSAQHIKLSNPTVETIIFMLNHGEITNSKSSFYKAHYYTVIWYLKKVGIVECFGVDEANEKRWRLTEKGKQLAIHLKAIIDMFQEKV